MDINILYLPPPNLFSKLLDLRKQKTQIIMHHLDLLKGGWKKSKTYVSQMVLFTMVKKSQKKKKHTKPNKSKIIMPHHECLYFR